MDNNIKTISTCLKALCSADHPSNGATAVASELIYSLFVKTAARLTAEELGAQFTEEELPAVLAYFEAAENHPIEEAMKIVNEHYPFFEEKFLMCMEAAVTRIMEGLANE